MDNDSIQEILCFYVAYLRFLYLLYQNSHWQTNGKEFYGNHLLFERLYKNTAENADQIAEKTIGLTNSSVLKFNIQINLIQKLCSKFSASENLIQNAIDCENYFQTFLKHAVEKFEKNGSFTLGLDNMIAQHADESEGRLYLLKQAL